MADASERQHTHMICTQCNDMQTYSIFCKARKCEETCKENEQSWTNQNTLKLWQGIAAEGGVAELAGVKAAVAPQKRPAWLRGKEERLNGCRRGGGTGGGAPLASVEAGVATGSNNMSGEKGLRLVVVVGVLWGEQRRTGEGEREGSS